MIFGRGKKPEETGSSKPAEAPTVPKVPTPAVQPAAPPEQSLPASQPEIATPIVAAPAAPDSAPAPASGAPALDDDQLSNRVMGAKMVAASFGEVVSILMRAQSYKHYSLSDLEWLVIPPVITQQFVLAEVRRDEGSIPAPVGVALWASVSEEVDRKLSTNLTAPMRLRPDEWKSGDILWLIDAVGPAQVLNGLIENLHKQVFKGRPLKIKTRDDKGNPVVKIHRLPATGDVNL